jgi:hypothetical protein
MYTMCGRGEADCATADVTFASAIGAKEAAARAAELPLSRSRRFIPEMLFDGFRELSVG